MRRRSFLLASLAPLLIFAQYGLSQEWRYQTQESWGDQCKEGKKQSPINIQRKKSHLTISDPFVFVNYDEPFHYTVQNNGHAISVKFDHLCNIAVLGGDLKGMYILDHVHFHWRSEHMIEGKRKPLEAHFVHYKKEYGNVSIAATHKNGLAVLGVLFEEVKNDNPVLKSLLPYFGNYSKEIMTPLEHFTLERLLPDHKAGFYRYQGSLTTPPCSEAVVWTVFKDTVPISSAQIDLLHNVNFKGEPENWREIQPLHNRELHLITYREKLLSCSSVNSSPLCLLLTLAGVIPTRPFHF